MIFRQANLVLNGDKSQHRIPVKDSDEVYIILLSGPKWVKPYANAHLDGMIAAVRDKNNRLKYAVHKDYAIQPSRGKKSVGRFEITGIRCEHLQSINLDDVVAEGYSIPGKMDVVKAKRWFRETWEAGYRKRAERWVANPLIYAIHMKVLSANKTTRSPF